jgi:hypothetical protein
MMESARTFETLVNFYQTTLRYNPEDGHLRTHRRENFKSYLDLPSFQISLPIVSCSLQLSIFIKISVRKEEEFVGKIKQ